MDKKFILTDILPKEQREKLIEDCKPYLKKIDDDHPAYQSDAPIRNYPPFFNIHSIVDNLASKFLQIDLIPEKSWFIMTQGNDNQYLMHNHPVDYVAVYYMNSHSSFVNGTEFEIDGFIEAPENSMLLFPGHLNHTPPKFEANFERYSMSFNWNFKD
tara:strand:+ start:1178 stop:1648 length:471 start_codon:yes stop_codon:yes gene_type:complete